MWERPCMVEPQCFWQHEEGIDKEERTIGNFRK